MRTRRTPFATTTRKVLTATAIAAAMTGFSLAIGGTASAATLSADRCDTTVTGAPTTQVAVDADPLAGIVHTATKERKNLLTLLSINPDQVADHLRKGGPVQVGRVPGSGAKTVDGTQIGEFVVQRLKDSPGLGWLPSTKQDTLDHIKKKVGGLCAMRLKATPRPTTEQPTRTGGDTGHTGSTGGGTPDASSAGGVPSGGSQGRAPRRDYGGIPTATPGVATPPGLRYPSPETAPGQDSPEFGILGADPGTQQAPDQAEVRNAGNADALAAEPAGNSVQLPMLLAVVALAGVTAALVRTWVLRKVS
ncbi:hypothetical protein [Amycolatopsis cihanbeyliensis]|uniref:Uncharacterized protein n=1 Tax=Amycolatopsis cihanbeyliensis TaxID=1128664 RepID=A0A542DL93_AMYCI|nr:hypothetical protein [Amycolatopsis cihanbeyliensis]TQJ03804.1 hypothetical protein FB471_3572 [Amycolatopsis cihanbeyliensis]